MPVGRTQIEWECELGVVIGRPAARVSEARAMDFVFGYTLQNDMSDRGGRGDTRFGSGLAHHEEPRHVRADGPVHHAEGVRRATSATWA